jgi:glycosyltransferase involved in cell wall biosynthesis
MAHNIESQIWFRRAHQSRTLPERAFSSLQARKMEWFERKALKHRQGIAAVSAEDAEQLRAWGVQGVSLVENGADVDQFMPVREAPHADRILFFASLDWYPNLDSLEYFLKAILPLVVRSRPGARLQVVGKGPAPGLEKQVSGFAGVEFVGEVTDVRPYLAQAAVVVVPLRIGGGSRIKILEALAMGKAVVSTSIGAEGLAVGHGIHLLLADTPADFASRTVDLLTSPQECRRLGGNGRRLVVEHYSWDRAAGALESAWQQACVLEPFCPSSDSAPNRLRAEVIP